MKIKLFLIFTLTCLTVFPQTQIGNSVFGSYSNASLGWSVSLSSDGKILAAGAPGIGGNVYVYENINSSWVQIGDAITGDNDQHGHSISLSSNGNILAISAAWNHTNGIRSGRTQIYENQGGSWVQIGQDIVGEFAYDGETNGQLPDSNVSLSADGSIVAIGATGNDGNGNNSGSVRVFRNDNNNWIQIGNTINGENQNDELGSSVSLSNDGSIIAIGAVHPISAGSIGYVKVYKNENDNWIQIGSNISSGQSDRFAESLSISGDGNVIAIGATGVDIGGSLNHGGVRIYRNTNDNWNQIGNTIIGEAQSDASGNSVSLSEDGNVVAIGAWLNTSNGNWGAGQVRIYKNESDNWVQVGADIEGDISGIHEGFSVRLSSDGSIVATGAINYDDVPNTPGDIGRVSVFDLSSVLSLSSIPQLVDVKVYPNPTVEHINVETALELSEISVWNLNGQLVKQAYNSNLIGVKSLPYGVYLLKIKTTNNSVLFKKIVVGS
ncbi:T9SS type A sorting domain-containing protein [Flavobacteriaceae bacterium S356]|uniref:T9SS type A sorting domain-containing protein n=1 Tax=Asprobacillus argus TaxID=3076534 RepID=A0ABU3LH99_9FLAO|nr:T9SS type A sorting domain-containing protein [Flavobacteriaceae bacterium S356]